MKILSHSTLLILSMALVPLLGVQAGAESPARKMAPLTLSQMDLNKDGRVSVAEFNRIHERDEGKRSDKGPRGHAAAQWRHQQPGQNRDRRAQVSLGEHLDRNGDGVISARELRDAR